MRNKLTKRTVGGGVVSAIGAVVLSLGGAAAAELSPQDRCAIAKLEATWQEAKCLTDAQIAGIRQGLTDQQVDRRKAVCRQREHASFENAEDRPGKCKTIDDDAAVDYALKLATDIPRACGESGPPCNAENPATLSNATIRNRTPYNLSIRVYYSRQFPFCNKDRDFTSAPAGQTAVVSAGICLIIRVEAIGEANCIDYFAQAGTWYRTFQIVPLEYHPRCIVNRP